MSEALGLLEKHATAQHDRGMALMEATAKVESLKDQMQAERGGGNLAKAQQLESAVFVAQETVRRLQAQAAESDKVERSAICARSGEILAELRADVDLAEVVLVGALNAAWEAAGQSMQARKRLSEVSSQLHNWAAWHHGLAPIAEVKFTSPSGEHSVWEMTDFWPKVTAHFFTRVEEGTPLPMDLKDYRARNRAPTAPSPMMYRSGQAPPGR